MGTNTPGKNLYKPTVLPAETGWGALVNANWDVLDDDSPTFAGMWFGECSGPAGGFIWDEHAWEFRFYWYQAIPLDHDTFTFTFMLKKGSYNFNVWGSIADNRGIIDWTLDGVAIETGQDWYDVGVESEDKRTTAAVAVTTSGRHTLVGTINDKNIGSGNYYIKLGRISFSP